MRSSENMAILLAEHLRYFNNNKPQIEIMEMLFSSNMEAYITHRFEIDRHLVGMDNIRNIVEAYKAGIENSPFLADIRASYDTTLEELQEEIKTLKELNTKLTERLIEDTTIEVHADGAKEVKSG